MKKTIRIFIFAALACLFASCASAPKTVYLADYLKEGMAEKDAMPAIREALAVCRETNATKLVLPEGTLRIWPDLAYASTTSSQ